MVVLVLVFYLCPSSVRVVATFPGTVLFPLLCSVLPSFPLIHWFFSLSSFVIPSKCLRNFICAASKRYSSLFFSPQASLPNFNAALATSQIHVIKICGTSVTNKLTYLPVHTGPFYCVPQRGSCPGIYRRMKASYAIKVPCMGRGAPCIYETLYG